MKRYTVFDVALGRYVVPLPKPQGEPPMVKMQIGGPQDLLFGEVVDHLAELEIDAEAAEKAEKEGDGRTWRYIPEHGRGCHITGRFLCPSCRCCTPRLEGQRPPTFCPNCGADMRKEADR